MMRVPFIFLLVHFPLLQGTLRCEDNNYSLLGRSCYRVETDQSKIKSNFPDQLSECEKEGAYLPSFDSIEAEDALRDQIALSFTPFPPFYIGLQCSDGFWQWAQSGLAYSADVARFEDIYIDKQKCLLSDLYIHFLMTTFGFWRADELFPTDYLPQIAVCQMNAVDDSTSTPHTPHTTEIVDDTPWVIGLACAVVLLIIVIVGLIFYFRKRFQQLLGFGPISRKSTRSIITTSQIEFVSSDPWEMGRQFIELKLSDQLGTGAFGTVYAGKISIVNLPKNNQRSIIQLSELKVNDGQVAIKMLHDSADKIAQLDFLQEIEIMKQIGYHERLVNMIACVTETQPCLLITELCSNGDLLTYLKTRREFTLTLPENMDLTTIDRTMLITQERQLQIAIQIAYGLEFLSSRSFVHRDIAARNILVDANHTCKIGDFGLCRRVEDQKDYYLSRGGRLPIKWMSPEALRRYEMSTASDVWSYGVLLFEIITLGGSPYPGWAPAEILPRLEAGERMSKPDNCPDEVFETMLGCWAEVPDSRPTFTELRSRLGKVLEQTPAEYYLQLNAHSEYYHVPSIQDQPITEEELF